MSVRAFFPIALLGACSLYGAAPGGTGAKKLIFLDFFNETNDMNLEFVANSIGDAVHDAIKGRYRYDRIPSDVWKAYAGGEGWQKRDFYDKKKIREMGRALGADGIIYGKYGTSGQQLELHGLIFSVIDGEIIGEQRANAPLSAEMFDMINGVAGNLAAKIKDLFVPSDRGAVVRSLAYSGWGHFYKQRSNWGYFWAGAITASILYTATTTTLFIIYKIKYADYSPQVYRNDAGQTGHYDQTASQAEFDRLESTGNLFGQLTLIGVGAIALVYGSATLHAWLIEPDLGNVRPPEKTSSLQINLSGDAMRGAAGIRGEVSWHFRF